MAVSNASRCLREGRRLRRRIAWFDGWCVEEAGGDGWGGDSWDDGAFGMVRWGNGWRARCLWWHPNRKNKGGDDFLREKGGRHCGIRQAFVACYKSETSSELGGVRLFDDYEGRHS
jgi:hypothetical protein